MRSKNYFSLILIFSLALLVSGCSISFQGDEKKSEKGGVFVSGNKGKTWKQMAAVPSTDGKPGSIGNIAVDRLVQDPSDSDAIYMASQGAGLYYTYNISEGWQKAKEMPNTAIDAVAVNPQSKCIIYASAQNKLFKSTDCNRTWEEVYYDNDKKARVTAIAIDHYDPSRIFIGTSRGLLLRSKDGGDTWSRIENTKNKITGLYVSPHDSRVMLATTGNKGAYRTEDGGEEWTSLKDNMKEFNNSSKIRDLTMPESEEGLVFAATNYGLLKSEDLGDNWSQIELITPEKKATINSIAVNSEDPEEMYYVTENTFYRSLDGGESWSTKALPTIRPGQSLLINPEEPNIIYLGVGPKPNN